MLYDTEIENLRSKKHFANRMRRLITYVDGYEILTLTQKITHYIQMCQMGRD